MANEFVIALWENHDIKAEITFDTQNVAGFGEKVLYQDSASPFPADSLCVPT